ncbi:integral peroxisomal membrane peroxin-domain-containing protein [Phlebopus sp. FC_14]|nr:integral peroxisomal membrane peroxin-domain-containing protein [Phlebopus sp. FC_14]
MSQSSRDFTLRPKILQMPSTPSASSAVPSGPVLQSPAPTLIEFVSTTPPPLTCALVALAPCIEVVRCFAEIVSWKSSWEESWLVVAAWWALCLLSEPMLKFFLPLAVLFVFTLRRLSRTETPTAPSPPATESTIHAVISDLTTIHELLPTSPSSYMAIPPSLTLARIAAFMYLPYLVLTYFVPLHICIAITGTLLLTYRAQWARNARAALTRSAHIRWSFYHIYSFISGTPLPTIVSPPPEYTSRPVSGASDYTSAMSHSTESVDLPPPSPPLRFLFTVYENQRWWMGLDWTAALLPGERPSWCSASQAPLPPPSAFSLPPPTTTFVAVGEKRRAKRVARWTWEEPEWRVVVRKEGQEGLWRIEKTPPKDKDAADDGTGTAARMLRAARGRDATATTSGASESPERDRNANNDQHVSGPGLIPGQQEEDAVTDPEGWLYGDNKWEGASCKGGMGKYTRYRRWTRIATLTETVELVGPGELGVVRDSGAFSTLSGGSTGSMATAGASSPTMSSFSDSETVTTAPEPPKEQQASGTRNMLRQRLKAVMDGSGH